MGGFTCVFCAKAIDPVLDRWLWLQVTSRRELVTAHQSCYENASARRASKWDQLLSYHRPPPASFRTLKPE